jgi:hypothetical protein
MKSHLSTPRGHISTVSLYPGITSPGVFLDCNGQDRLAAPGA